MQVTDFGDDFAWGVASAAFQTEGAYLKDGKGYSIWDAFTDIKGKVYQNQNARQSCDFYHRYTEDIKLLKQLGISHFRFSLSWPRIFPDDSDKLNDRGIDYYQKVVDTCLENGVVPWITLYHWDLPWALEQRGGWTSREIIDWFGEYADQVSRKLGDRVHHWMVLNEPLVFTGAGYFLGIHAPGRRGMKNFLPAIHHATLCQAVGGSILRDNCPNAQVDTTYSCRLVEPYSNANRDIEAARREDTLLNRLFIEPTLRLGYTVNSLPVLRRLDKYMQTGDEEQVKFNFYFYGLQNYTR